MQLLTCDMDYSYTAEQQAFNGGEMDKFVQFTQGQEVDATHFCPAGSVMGYFDGNTVTAM